MVAEAHRRGPVHCGGSRRPVAGLPAQPVDHWVWQQPWAPHLAMRMRERSLCSCCMVLFHGHDSHGERRTRGGPAGVAWHCLADRLTAQAVLGPSAAATGVSCVVQEHAWLPQPLSAVLRRSLGGAWTSWAAGCLGRAVSLQSWQGFTIHVSMAAVAAGAYTAALAQGRDSLPGVCEWSIMSCQCTGRVSAALVSDRPPPAWGRRWCRACIACSAEVRAAGATAACNAQGAPHPESTSLTGGTCCCATQPCSGAECTGQRRWCCQVGLLRPTTAEMCKLMWRAAF